MHFHTMDNSTEMALPKAVPSQEISMITFSVKANNKQSPTITLSMEVYFYQYYISV